MRGLSCHNHWGLRIKKTWLRSICYRGCTKHLVPEVARILENIRIYQKQSKSITVHCIRRVHSLYLVYAGNMLITSSNEEYVQIIVRKIGEEFAIRQLGDLQFFLGIQVHCSEEEIHLHQQQYLVNLLKSSSLDNLNPTKTPMEASIILVHKSSPCLDEKKYRRPDTTSWILAISYTYKTRYYFCRLQSCIVYGCFTVRTQECHKENLQLSIQYLRNGDQITKMNELCVIGYCDVDWVSDQIDHRSQIVFLIYIW